MLDNTSLNASSFNHDFLFPYLQESFIILINSYFDILSSKRNYTDYSENYLRDEIVKIAELKDKNLQFVWDTESRNLQSNEVRIDISLIYSLSIKTVEERISIECKIINLAKCSDYITRNGIISFVEGKYSSKLPLCGMIGFIEKDNPIDIVNKLNNLLKGSSSIKTNKYIEHFEIVSTFKDSYLSNHERKKETNSIKIYHLLFDYSTEIITK